jgi:hypothetical protein
MLEKNSMCMLIELLYDEIEIIDTFEGKVKLRYSEKLIFRKFGMLGNI